MKKSIFSGEFKMEVVVGAFILMVLLGLGYFTIILSRETFFGTKHRIEIKFVNVMGLGKGDNVVVRGMPIGKVRELQLKPDGVMVICDLDQELLLRNDYQVSVVATSILGGRHLEISEGALGPLPEGAAVVGKEAYDLMADASDMIHELKLAMTSGGVVSNLQGVVSDLREITTRVRDGKSTVGRLLSEDDTLYRDLSATAASLKNLTARLEQGEGTLGKLMSKDDTVYDEVKKAIIEVRATIDDYRETSPIVTFTSVFFGAF
jgi:phospholipid/cholesterol/gamma-HCH transport system substrate-binding protein